MPGGQIKTPTNQKLLTNVAVVRMKKNGKRFEVACYKNKVLNWRNKTEKDIDEVLQTQSVFTNVSKGQLAKRDELIEAFGTENQLEICKLILDKGDLQVSDKERQVTAESSFKEVANIIANMCVDPETKRPYSPAVIEKALRDQHFSLKSNRSAKQHALEAIPKLRETMKIDRAKMRLRVAIPAKEAKMLHDKLKALFSDVEVEDWEKGDLEIVGLVEPGNYRTIAEMIKAETRSHGQLELLSLKVVNDAEVEIA
ncbi:shwachman-Bodian-Diamond syndrome [Aphelenchoides avenae]|nr:shwachman-Bodian-Diamond syndrome [Aphelenchus avenae]